MQLRDIITKNGDRWPLNKSDYQKIPDKIQNIHKCNRLQKQPAFSNKLEERH